MVRPRYTNFEKEPLIGTSSLGVQYVAKIFHQAPMGIWYRKRLWHPRLRNGNRWPDAVVYREHCHYCVRMESRQKIEGVGLVSYCLLDLFVCGCVVNAHDLYFHVSYEDFVINAYFWLMIGILFRLPTLSLSSQFASVRSSAAGPRRPAR